jgi:hypothetical protein
LAPVDAVIIKVDTVESVEASVSEAAESISEDTRQNVLGHGEVNGIIVGEVNVLGNAVFEGRTMIAHLLAAP